MEGVSSVSMWSPVLGAYGIVTVVDGGLVSRSCGWWRSGGRDCVRLSVMQARWREESAKQRFQMDYWVCERFECADH
jgi:hypothetical protein